MIDAGDLDFGKFEDMSDQVAGTFSSYAQGCLFIIPFFFSFSTM